MKALRRRALTQAPRVHNRRFCTVTLQQHFDSIDTDKNGEISFSELCSFLETMPSVQKSKLVRINTYAAILEEFDVNKDNVMCIDEFEKFMEQLKSQELDLS